MTFDNTHELHKIKRLAPNAELLLRFAPDDSTSAWPLSTKFGAHLESVGGLLCLAKGLGLNVVGVSFHIGSGASDPKAFTKAVKDARRVFDEAAKLGLKLTVLDVGGGFVTTDLFETSAKALSDAFETYFPPSLTSPSPIEIIAEPGRYFVFDAFTLACNIIGRRDAAVAKTALFPHQPKITTMLYLNDGIYGNFSNVHFDYHYPQARVLACCADESKESQSGKPTEYSLWGPTCDSGDCVAKSIMFREALRIGDWLYFEEMGAYTSSCGTLFNGFTSQHEVVYVSSELVTKALLGY